MDLQIATQGDLVQGASTQARIYKFFADLSLNIPTVIEELSPDSVRSYAYNYNRAPSDHRISVRKLKDGRIAVEKVSR
jgi:hypothetical protein